MRLILGRHLVLPPFCEGAETWPLPTYMPVDRQPAKVRETEGLGRHIDQAHRFPEAK
jgi:hypothetical protein